MCQLCRTFGFEVWDLCKASVLRVLQFVSGVIQHWWRFGTLFLEKEGRFWPFYFFSVVFDCGKIWDSFLLNEGCADLSRDFPRILSREPFGNLQSRLRGFVADLFHLPACFGEVFEVLS